MLSKKFLASTFQLKLPYKKLTTDFSEVYYFQNVFVVGISELEVLPQVLEIFFYQLIQRNKPVIKHLFLWDDILRRVIKEKTKMDLKMTSRVADFAWFTLFLLEACPSAARPSRTCGNHSSRVQTKQAAPHSFRRVIKLKTLLRLN